MSLYKDDEIIKNNSNKKLRGMNTRIQFFFIVYFQSLENIGFLEDTEITFIDKTDLSDPTRHENF